jgi:hypothetical protein
MMDSRLPLPFPAGHLSDHMAPCSYAVTFASAKLHLCNSY